MSKNLKTIRDFTRYAITEFERCGVSLGHGSEDFWQEATFLVLRSLHLPFERLESFWGATLTAEEKTDLLEKIRQRAVLKIPTSYLLGEAWLAGERFYVNEDVLIPRSFIAELLDADVLDTWIGKKERVKSVLDMCTGGGSLAILAQLALPEAQVTGADISEKALAVAAVNREDYGLADSLELIVSDQFAQLQGRRFDLIICNPPYVTEEAMRELPGEYRHEPTLALASGVDGMDFLRRFMPELRSHLTARGMALVEIGDGREAFEALWPELHVEWMATSAGDSLVFLVQASDLKAAGL